MALLRIGWIMKPSPSDNHEYIATVGSNGRFTIPRTLRQVMEIKPGDRMKWDLNEDGDLTLQHAPAPKESPIDHH